MAGGGPAVCNPAADQAESLGCPFLGTNNPWTAFVFGRKNDGKTPFKWTYLHSLGGEQMHMCLADAFDKIPNNKKVALLFPTMPMGRPKPIPRPGLRRSTRRWDTKWSCPRSLSSGSRGLHRPDRRVQEAGCDVLSGRSLS